jgi:hypothetical protein
MSHIKKFNQIKEDVVVYDDIHKSHKIYTYSTSHYGSGVCIANSLEEAKEMFRKNYTFGSWDSLELDDDGIQEFPIEHGFCHIDYGDA